MGVLDKLDRKIERILLIGHTAHGKTYNCTRIALNLAKKGKRVLYIDNEQGSFDEWETLAKEGKLTKEIDKNIILVTPKDFLELKDYALNYQDKVNCIVIDPLSFNVEARITAKEKILQRGKRILGEAEIPIDDPETFHLRGFDYQLPNEWQMELVRGLAKGRVHFIVTELITAKIYEELDRYAKKMPIDQILNTVDESKLPKKLKELLDLIGYFDRVIWCERTAINGKKKYFGIIVKWRGKDLSGEKVDNVAEFLLKNTKLLK
ncbi:MAG: AAA family ATPase [Desulfonauticus sp.]|nr:AAA family ATPase [Desulfonauticus sp.]